MVHVALLRGVNVGGRTMVAMAELRALLETLGLGKVRTLLASGNAVFESPKLSGAKLEGKLEEAIRAGLGVETTVLVRTPEELEEAVAANPFREEARSDPARLHVMFLRSAPAAAHVSALQAAIKGRETVRASGRHAYLFYPDGMGKSRLTIDVIEKHLAARGTARNWNTVTKLAALARE